ncbi:ubiquitin thioesterase trabid-like isoform X1 [Anopheles merus]|uniref:ubiquitin thioesterase trabid-like isoform X1 n=1 Tax=Anopheles merus TaxID=30066 RepID=UPI001BE4A723|nr:ubiquitin thioesterase trabid-like isoform X1 [Anopheles merus]XP_041786782.1 ubiquitin thioesterase trabid-like isoform X1 [Anopheles merus]XP_041786783.1 ubiquitin thioesterase trabid-like isoform X1 [Anopheles merus]
MSGSSSTNKLDHQQQEQETVQQQQQQQEQQQPLDETQQQEQQCPQQQPKWVCEYCTYENYPLSLKCIMCKGTKPLLKEDIFRLSPTQQLSATSRSNPNLASGAVKSPSITELDSNQRWPCSACTYLNLPHTRRCLQCDTVRKEDQQDHHQQHHNHQQQKVISEYDSISEHLNAMNICRSGPSPGEDGIVSTSGAGSGKRNRNNSPASGGSYGSSSRLGTNANDGEPATGKGCASDAKHSPSPVSSSPVSTMSRAVASSQVNAGKWFCSVCTYENWPKSLKCSMCLHPRDSTTSTVGSRSNQAAAKASPEHDENTINVASNIMVNNKRNQQFVGHADSINNMDACKQERYLQLLRRQPDWDWLNACVGIAENNIGAVEAYLECGGDPSRALTSAEAFLISRNNCAFDVGHTLIHLAIRFHRDEMLPLLLAQISGSGPGIKRVPAYVAPDLASDIRRHFAQSLRIRKASFNCQFVNEHATFSLPADIEELPLVLQEQLYEELLDKDAQKQLEMPPPALNWSLEITDRLGSRLMVLWNRSAGDCLLDSVMQATWGVFDRDNTLRRALADSLHQCSHIFYPRWKENELFQAALLQYTVAEMQLEKDWNTLLSLASHPGSSLEQLHIFALAHIMRRPIVVYGVKYVKSFRGEDIGFARFEGVYLPLLWEQSFCITSPIALGYTRGHFSALVPTEPYSRIDATRDDREDITFLPLMDCEMKLLPIHFLTKNEIGREEMLLRQWLEVCETEGGLLVAQQKLHKRPLLVAQLLEEWLNHYRRIAYDLEAVLN